MTAYLATLTHTGLTMRVDELPATPSNTGDLVTYTPVRDAAIPLPVVAAAHQQLGDLAASLDIPMPRLRWFARKDEAPHDLVRMPGDHYDFEYPPIPFDSCVLGGFADPDPAPANPSYCEHGPLDPGLLPAKVPTVWVLASLRGDLLRMVIAHEVRHLAQPADMTREERERDAEAYGMSHVA